MFASRKVVARTRAFFEILGAAQRYLHFSETANGREETRMELPEEYAILAWVMNCTTVVRAFEWFWGANWNRHSRLL